MIFSVIGIGILSALTPGPSTFNLMKLRLHYGRIPWKELSALIAGDILFFLIALYLLNTSWLQLPWLQQGIQLFTAAALLWFAVKGLLGIKNTVRDGAERGLITGPARVFALTVSNPNVLLIYLSLVGMLPLENKNEKVFVMGGYFLAFVISFFVFLWVVGQAKGFMKRIERPLELLVCSGFLIYSLRIVAGVL